MVEVLVSCALQILSSFFSSDINQLIHWHWSEAETETIARLELPKHQMWRTDASIIAASSQLYTLELDDTPVQWQIFFCRLNFFNRHRRQRQTTTVSWRHDSTGRRQVRHLRHQHRSICRQSVSVESLRVFHRRPHSDDVTRSRNVTSKQIATQRTMFVGTRNELRSLRLHSGRRVANAWLFAADFILIARKTTSVQCRHMWRYRLLVAPIDTGWGRQQCWLTMLTKCSRNMTLLKRCSTDL